MRDNGIAPPFLRAPQFPRVSSSSASITSGRASEPFLATPATLEQVASARVGGTFWRATAQIEAGTTLVRRSGAIFSEVAELPNDCDPWGTLAKAARLVTDDDDEWTIIAGLSGVTVTGHDGAVRSAEALNTLASTSIGAWAYRDPFTGGAASIEAAIDLLRLWRQTFDANRCIAALAGIRRWKRDTMEDFFFDGARTARVTTMDSAIADAEVASEAVAYWPSRVEHEKITKARNLRIPLVTIEDGFVRSSGLGSNMTLPASLAVDWSGIHYDPTTPSDLETLLETQAFPPALLDRARGLIASLLNARVGKYGRQPAIDPAPVTTKTSRRRLLVLGQVDDDESVRYGRSETVGSNEDLLRAVRTSASEADIAYRPHPDVVAGHRLGGISETDALKIADRISEQDSLFAAMATADEIHVLTSLAGFEALIRGHHVVVHGRPFYAGWGLTDDREGNLPRRTRRLTIEQLVAGALILYPRYIDPVTRLPCTVETVVRRIAQGTTRRTLLSRLRAAQGKIGSGIGRAVASVQ